VLLTQHVGRKRDNADKRKCNKSNEVSEMKEHRNALKFFELNFEKAFYHSLCSKKKNMQWEIGTQQTMILPVET